MYCPNVSRLVLCELLENTLDPPDLLDPSSLAAEGVGASVSCGMGGTGGALLALDADGPAIDGLLLVRSILGWARVVRSDQVLISSAVSMLRMLFSVFSVDCRIRSTWSTSCVWNCVRMSRK